MRILKSHTTSARQRLAALLLSALFATSNVAKPVQVEITGVSNPVKRNVLESLSLLRLPLDEAPQWRVRQLQKRGVKEAHEALRPFGYYRARIETSVIEDADTILVKYQITPGEPIRLSRAEYELLGEGQTLPAFMLEMEMLPLLQGDVLLQPPYEDFKKRLLTIAEEHGFFDATFKRHDLLVDLHTDDAQLFLTYDTGPRYQLGSVHFEQDAYSDSFLQRFVPFEPGSDYDIELLDELQNILSQQDYFSSVSVLPLQGQAHDKEVPITVRLSPLKKYRYTASLGYGTDAGVRGSLQWDARRITTDGHRLSTYLKASQYQWLLGAFYRIPARKPAKQHWQISLGHLLDDPPGRELRSQTSSIGLSFNNGGISNHIQRQYSLRYQLDQFDERTGHRHASLLMPGLEWVYYSDPDRIVAESGQTISISGHAAHESLFSSTSFLQLEASAKWLQQYHDHHRLIWRTKLAATLKESTQNLPLSLRFFAGGDNSVRGYGYQSLGPKQFNDNGEEIVVGGPLLLEHSLEYQYQIYQNWYLAAFHDIGNAMDTMIDEPLKQGIGVGVNWRSPLGALRMYLAYALDGRDEPYRLHFDVGPDL